MPSEGKKCPKCGAEMDKMEDLDFNEEGEYCSFGWDWVCKCGHEEKVSP